MKIKKTAQSPKKEAGQSMTELAVSFTLLVLLLSIAVDGGRLLFSYISIREAAEEGVLHASLFPTDSTGIEARVRTSSSNPVDLTDTSSVLVTNTVISTACAGNSVRVTVYYNFNLTMPMVGAILGTPIFPISAASTATILQPGC